MEDKFSDYYEKWVSKLEEYVQELGKACEACLEAPQYNELVAKLTAHHKEYYTFKWIAAKHDVLHLFSPAWLIPLENAYLWVTGWKPSMAFKLIESVRVTGGGLADLTEEQMTCLETLKNGIKIEEEKVEREMERQQVGMADRRMVELARMSSEDRDGVTVERMVDVAVKGLMVGLERVMKMADCARLKTLKGVLDVLGEKQSVKFLGAFGMIQVQLRQWGKENDSREADI